MHVVCQRLLSIKRCSLFSNLRCHLFLGSVIFADHETLKNYLNWCRILNSHKCQFIHQSAVLLANICFGIFIVITPLRDINLLVSQSVRWFDLWLCVKDLSSHNSLFLPLQLYVLFIYLCILLFVYVFIYSTLWLKY